MRLFRRLTVGDPAGRNDADRRASLRLARAVVEAEWNDIEWPKLAEGRARYHPFCDELDEPSSRAVHALCQDLVELRRAYELVCAEHEVPFEKPFEAWMAIEEEEASR
jgi:hypothetical protein